MAVKPGIYVAFGRHGEHFGYARHPKTHDCPKRSLEQTQKVEVLQEEARRCGGKVLLLSLDDFDRLILLNIMPEDHEAPFRSDVAA